MKNIMRKEQCPFCGSEFEIREVTPCIECGAGEERVQILKKDIAEGFEHDSIQYNLYRIFDELEIVLCDPCALDLGSYDPEYFGLSKYENIGFGKLQFLKKIDNPYLSKDKYCPECKQRLAYIKFLIEARKFNSS